jgi:hypothetical protein
MPTPELDAIHHRYDVHKYDSRDIRIRDLLFGTYRDTTEPAARCGLPIDAERRPGATPAFKDGYDEDLPNNALQSTPNDGRGRTRALAARSFRSSAMQGGAVVLTVPMILIERHVHRVAELPATDGSSR